MNKLLNIIAVDDHPLFLVGLAETLRLIPCVGRLDTCHSYTELEDKLREYIPDIIFLDLNMPKHDGFKICTDIHVKYKNIFIAIITSYDTKQFIEKARTYGAGAYFSKNTGLDDYTAFLNDFNTGLIKNYFVFIPPVYGNSTDILKDGFELKAALTRREREVMKMILDGHEHREIERTLGIEYETFRAHHNKILVKLGVRNDVELVHFAKKHLTDADY